VISTDTSGETSAVRYKLGETIEQPCIDFLAHTLKVCKGAHPYNGYLLARMIKTHGERVQPLQSVKLL
jgi:hypothetical protein